MKRGSFSTLVAAAFLLCAGAAAGEPVIHLSALPGAVRVRPTGDPQGSPVAKLSCARNESESFQIIITATGGNAERIETEMTALRSHSGDEIPLERIAIYREIFVPVRHSAPRATQPPGPYPDALAPFVNPYTGEAIRASQWRDGKRTGARFGGTGFDLWEDHHQPLWIDVHVPGDARPGVYTGTVRVWGRNAEPATVAVELTVWDFVLPDGPTHENHFGHFSYMARYHGLDGNSEEYRQLEDRYMEMMAAHRINPPLPARLRPNVGDDGDIQIADDLDRQLEAFVDRYRVTNIDIPRAPFRDPLNADRAKAIRFYRSWYAYLDTKGWAERSYLYMLDEPNDAEAYERVRQLGALVHDAEPRIRRLVVEQPYTQDPDWGVLNQAIDIWCPLFGFVHEPSIKRVQAAGDEVWSYTALVQRAPQYHPGYESVKNDHPPYWQMDFPVLSYRIAPWLNRRYGITGLLYWTTVCWTYPERNPWDDPGFRIRWNGEGQLFYPGDEAGIDGPISTIRLKNLRDGMEDYEYFAILDRLGKKGVAESIVAEAVPTWGTWVQDPERLLELRRRLAEAIIQGN